MIQPAHVTLAIMLMAIITFAVRYSFFTRFITIKLTPKLKKLLIFTAPCVLTAMLAPIMFQEALHTGKVTALANSSYFLAGVCAVVFSVFIRSTLTVIVLSMLVFYGLRAVGVN